MQSCQNRSQCR